MILLILVAALLVLFYIHCIKTFKYWEQKNVYFEKPLPIFGNFLNVAIRQEQMGFALKNIYDKLDDTVPYFGVFIFHTPHLVIKSKEFIKQVLIRDFNYFPNRNQYTNEKVDPLAANVLFSLKNEVWKTSRNKLTPVFTSGKMKMMLPLMKEVTDQLEDILNANNGQEIDIRDLSQKYSVDIISSCAFGINAGSLKNPKAEIKKMSDQMLDEKGFKRSFAIFSWFFCPLLVDIFRIPFVEKESSQFLINVYKHSSEERKSRNVKRHDLIDLLNELKEEEVENDIFKFDDVRMSAQALTFFNAGANGTSTLLSLCLYEMAVNPEIQKTLRTEIVQNLDADGSLSYESLFGMEYLDLVMKEALRKYPFIHFLARYAEKDYIFEETGLKIEKGTKILIPMLAIHYDEKYYPNPNKFDPERFRGDKMKNLQYVYLSFGEGPRKCIGERFALMSMKLGLAMFLKNFEISPGTKTEIPLRFTKAATFITPEKGTIFLKIQKCNS
ncbi:hypothetical protein HHI36_008816 [Cryptolaemus montrouzieri]|uniref:Cytochrome P450 n=1 Tax=Cryptolaemus montrouzieri TaxID=559131 RepID=A0ABD2MUF3_9CUCU